MDPDENQFLYESIKTAAFGTVWIDLGPRWTHMDRHEKYVPQINSCSLCVDPLWAPIPHLVYVIPNFTIVDFPSLEKRRFFAVKF